MGFLAKKTGADVCRGCRGCDGKKVKEKSNETRSSHREVNKSIWESFQLTLIGKKG